MSRKKIPYTILRNGVYWLNVRTPFGPIRTSLKTREPVLAQLRSASAILAINANNNSSSDANSLRQLAKASLSNKLPPNHQALTQTITPESTIPLSDAWAEYSSEMRRGRWRSNTITTYEAAFSVLTDIVGNPPLAAVTKELCRRYKQELLDYPLFRMRGERSRQSLEELRNQNPNRIAPKTIAIQMGVISSFLNWSVRQGYLLANPLTGMAPKRSHNQREDRQSFSTQDLHKIFSHPSIQVESVKNCWQFWLPILALYTGARLEELCQLRGSDIESANNIYWLRIHPENGNRLKNSHSARNIPIHREIINLGFLKLATEKDKDYLFDFKPVNGKRGHYPSKWFGTFKSKMGFDKRKTFHSFRHTLRDALSEVDAPGEIIKAILGHEQGDETFGRYGSKFKEPTLNMWIQKLNFTTTNCQLHGKCMDD